MVTNLLDLSFLTFDLHLLAADSTVLLVDLLGELGILAA